MNHCRGRSSSTEDLPAHNSSPLHDRVGWRTRFGFPTAANYEKSMPPTDLERQQILAWIRQLAAQLDPALVAHDPSKPVLRHLTRLERTQRARFVRPNHAFKAGPAPRSRTPRRANHADGCGEWLPRCRASRFFPLRRAFARAARGEFGRGPQAGFY